MPPGKFLVSRNLWVLRFSNFFGYLRLNCEISNSVYMPGLRHLLSVELSSISRHKQVCRANLYSTLTESAKPTERLYLETCPGFDVLRLKIESRTGARAWTTPIKWILKLDNCDICLNGQESGGSFLALPHLQSRL